MLRINLLPSYVAQRRLSKRLVFGFTALLIILLVGLLGFSAKLHSDLTNETQLAQEATQGQSVTQGLQAQAASTLAQIQPIQQKLDFYHQVLAYNDSLANLYYTLAKYTDSNIIYSDAVYSGNTMTIKAYSPSLSEVGRYLERMYQDPQFSSVTIDKIPGYSDAFLRKYYVGSTLVSVGNAPNGQGAGGPGGISGAQNPYGPGAMQGGPNGPPGGFMGGPNGPGGQLGQTNTLSQYGKANQIMTSIASGVGQPVTPIDQLIQSKINPLALPRQAAEYAQQLRDSVYVKKQKLGFNFTVTATLVNPPVAPAVPGSASSANANGMGGMGGFGGGGTVGGPDAGAPPWAQGS